MDLPLASRRHAQRGRLRLPVRVRWRRRQLGPYLLSALLCLAAGWAAYQAVLGTHLASEREASARRLDFFMLSLGSMLDRNEALPSLLVLDGRLAQALEGGADARQAANHYLEAVAQAAGVSAVYLMDASGQTIAASNWNQSVTFVGQNYGFRPYVRDALAHGFGRFYGIGATTGEAGYFLAAPVVSGGRTLGVIAVKLNLLPFEDALRQSGEAVLVADKAGVVILSSEAAWRYRTLEPLAPEARERLAQARQYVGQPLQPLLAQGRIGPGRQTAPLARGEHTGEHAIVRRPLGSQGWEMLILTPQWPSQQVGAIAGVAATALAGCVLGFGLHLRLTRQRREDKRQAQALLRQAHEDLERRIAQRTADLTQANSALESRVDALKRTETILRATRDAAVQAGKLTVLGQMAAGMTHELNQPLAALHTLSDNAATLIAQDRVPEAQENLQLISQLVDRMGRIVRQLKVFARKEPASLEPVPVGAALEHALLLVEPRRREVGATIAVEPVADGLQVQADALRLEQVLVNLLRNGLDAVAGQPSPRLQVDVRAAGACLRLVIRDHGSGIPPESLPRLFEPFYTTKPAGQGLGLGLALSLVIAESFGGTIEARNAEGGGAEFQLVLDAA